MQIFESPLILILIVCFFLLGGALIYFTAKGLKTSNCEEENEFSNINKLEVGFARSGKLRENRGVMYINIFPDNYRGLYSEEKTARRLSQIKRILLQSFSSGKNGFISAYGENTYIAYSTLVPEEIRAMVEAFNGLLNKCLIDNGALNLIDVKIGIFFAFGYRNEIFG